MQTKWSKHKCSCRETKELKSVSFSRINKQQRVWKKGKALFWAPQRDLRMQPECVQMIHNTELELYKGGGRAVGQGEDGSVAIDPLCIRGCILLRALQYGCMSYAASSDLSSLRRLPVAVVINYVHWPCNAHESSQCDTSKRCTHPKDNLSQGNYSRVQMSNIDNCIRKEKWES